MSIDLNKIFFKTDTYDPATKLPIYVLDTTALPIPNSSNFNFLTLIQLLIDRIPNSNYVLVFFTSGLSKNENEKFSWVWGVKTFSLIPKNKRKYLRKCYIVHESWWIRALIEVTKNLVSSKFLKREKIIHCSNISELSKHIDITKINISLANYSYEYYKLNEEEENNKNNKKLLNLSHSDSLNNIDNQIIIPIHLPDIFGISIEINNHLTWYYYNLIFIKFLQLYYFSSSSSKSVNLILFTNDSKNLKFKTKVLEDSILRNQLINLEEFEILTILNLWKKFFKNLKNDKSLISLNFLNQNLNNSKNLNLLVNQLFELNGYKQLFNDLMNFFIIPMILNDCNHLTKNLSSNNDIDLLVEKYLTKISKFLMQFLCGILSGFNDLEKSKGNIFIFEIIKNWNTLDINLFKKTNSKSSGKIFNENEINLNLIPNDLIKSNKIIKNLFNYLINNNIINNNIYFLNDKLSIFNKLNDNNHLNNFNVIPKNDFEYKEISKLSKISLKTLNSMENKNNDNNNEEKENQKPLNSQDNNNFKKINNKIKTYFKPLSESNLLDSSTNELSLKFSNFSINNFKKSTKSENSSLLSSSSSLSMNSNTSSISSIMPPPPRIPPPRKNSNLSNNSSSETIFKKPPILPPRDNSSINSSTRHSSQESLISINSNDNKLVNKKSSNSIIKIKPQGSQEFILKDKKKYAGIQNGKVGKLALLFEERLEGIEIINSMDQNISL